MVKISVVWVLIITLTLMASAQAVLNDGIFDPSSDFNVFTRNDEGDTFGVVNCESLVDRPRDEKFRKLYFEYGVSGPQCFELICTIYT